MDPNDVSKADQGSAFLAEFLPPLWRKLYLGCVEQGFKDDEALLLVRTYIHGTAGGRMEK